MKFHAAFFICVRSVRMSLCFNYDRGCLNSPFITAPPLSGGALLMQSYADIQKMRTLRGSDPVRYDLPVHEGSGQGTLQDLR